MSLLQRIFALSLAVLFATSAQARDSSAKVVETSGISGTSFFTVTPCRVFDTRIDNTPLLSGATRVFTVAGQCGISPAAAAVSVNLTITEPTGAGFLTAFPGDAPRPSTSTINFVSGKNRGNNAIIPLAANGDGTLALFAFVQGAGQVHAILDVNGYFATEDLEILSLSPSSAPQGGAELVITVTGTGFQNDVIVRFDGYDLVTTQTAADRLTAVVPAARLGTAGTYPVQVVNPDGTASEATLFTVDAPLALNALVPAGVATGSPSFSLTLSGAGFKSGAVARFGGTSLATAYAGSGMLTATVPAALISQPGTVSVDVQNPGGSTSTPLSFKVKTLSLSGIQPTSGPVGTAVTITGDGLDLLPTVLFSKQGGGNLQAALLSSAPTTLQVSVPTGAATGSVRLVSGGLTLTGPVFTVIPSRTFDLAGGPTAGVVFPGSSVNYGITATSTNGFASLVSLQVNGLPSGVTFKLDPPQISAGQTSNLTVSAPAGQPTGLTSFSVTGTGSNEGQTLNRTLALSINVRPVTTSFMGRVAAAEAFEHPLVGVTVQFLGKNEQGAPNGCSMPPLLTDAGGNFAFVDVPSACTGPQLVGFDGVTESGELYTPVNLRFDIQAGVINHTPGLIHLTAIYDAETVLVRQNWSSDQIFTFQTIPGLKLQVYAGTIFTNPDGSTPDPFPLSALRIPIDRPPGDKTFPVGQIMPFLLSLQPEGSSASQPVAVDYPNTVDGPPGSVVTLLTLDPRVGMMVSYGTGTISADGLSIIADPNPTTPGRRYGLTHFDWHGPITPDVPAAGRGPTGHENGAVLTGACAAEGSCNCQTLNSVEYATGAEETNDVDAVVTGTLLPIALVRTYRSDLASFTGPFGLGTSHNFSYTVLAGANSSQAKIEVASPNGSRLSFTRQPNGSYLAPVASIGRGSVLRWDSLQGEYSLTAIDGSVFLFRPAFFVAARSSLTAILDRHGNRIELERGVGTGNVEILQRIVSPNGEDLALQYDSQNRIQAVTDFAGRITRYAYDSSGRLARITDPAGGVTRYGYDDQNHLTTITDARGILVITKEYDAVGRVVREVFPDTAEVHYSYITANPSDPSTPVLQTQVTDPLGHTTTYRFTVTGELTDVTDALGQRVSFEIDPVSGRYRERVGTASCPICGSPASNNQSYEYDEQGRLAKLTDALGHSTTYTYPPIGEIPETITDALQRKTILTQSLMGDVTSITDPAGKITLLTYDDAGRLLSLTDPNHNAITVTYGADGRPITIADALNRTVTYMYDRAGRLAAKRAPDGTTEYITYNLLDRITGIEDGIGLLTSLNYDASGNVLSLTNPRGNSTTYVYDESGRVAREIAPDGAERLFTYDLNSNSTSVVDRNGRATMFTYDALGRLSEALYQDGTRLRFEWDASGRLLAADDFAGGRIERGYDVVGHLVSEISPTGWLLYEYDSIGRRRARAGPDGLTFYTYTMKGQLDSITNGSMGAQFTYDDAGRLTSVNSPNSIRVSYTYDAGDQVTRIDYAGPAGITDFRLYNHDLNGRVTSVAGDAINPLPPPPQVATFDSRDRLVRLNGRAFQYNSEGQLLNDGLRTYSWDARGLLIGTIGVEGSESYQYDAIARRSGKRENAASIFFLYDLFSYLRIIKDSAPTDYLNGLSLDSALASRTYDSVRSYLQDRLGSVFMAVDQNGLSSRIVYDEYGAAKLAEGSSLPALRYLGRDQDQNGLIYLRARYYDPLTGRFVSEDPVTFRGTSANLYSYTPGDPVNFSDPRGEFAHWIAIAAAGGLINGILDAASAIGECKDAGEVARDFANGFISGAVGSAVGVFAGAFAGGAIGDITKQLLQGRKDLDFGEALSDGLLSMATEGIVDLIPNLEYKGRRPSGATSRRLGDFNGPLRGKNGNVRRSVAREFAGGVVDKLLSVVLSDETTAGCGCR